MMFSGQTNIIHSSVTLLAGVIVPLFLSLSQTTGRALVNNESGVTSCKPAALTTH